MNRDTTQAIQDEIVKCPECLSRCLSKDDARGENVCIDCGLVVEDHIVDQGAEWNVYDVTDMLKNARTGAPMTEMLHDKGLSTDIDWQNKDYAGNRITLSRSQLYRMRKWQKRSRVSNGQERNLVIALSEIDRMCSRLDIPKHIREHACIIYRKSLEKRICRGRSIESVVAASVYLGCRECNVPRTLDEVSVAARTGRKEIGRAARYMVRHLGMRMSHPRARDFTARFCSMLGLPPEVKAQADEYMRQIEDKELDSGRGPVGLCASCIYVASIIHDCRRTQKELAIVSGVTEVTIRNRYKEIVHNLGIEMPV
jgi:transcription initiation factor TFIIB